jgi:hypothetical protein
MSWIDPYIDDTVNNIRRVADELWETYLEDAKGSSFEDFKQHKNSFGKSALYSNVALGLSAPYLSDSLSEMMGSSSPKTPTGKEEMMGADLDWIKALGTALDVSDRITAEWDVGADLTGGYRQADTRTYLNVRSLIEAVKQGPAPAPEQEVPQEEQLSLLDPQEVING